MYRPRCSVPQGACSSCERAGAQCTGSPHLSFRSKSTMWIPLIPCWERIAKLRVVICSGPKPKSPAEAATSSEGVQTHFQASVTYPSAGYWVCSTDAICTPEDESKPQSCWCTSCAGFTEAGFKAFPIIVGHNNGMVRCNRHYLIFSH